MTKSGLEPNTQRQVSGALRQIVAVHPLHCCEIEQRGGISRGYLSKLLASDRITFEQLDRVLRVLKIPSADFFTRVRFSEAPALVSRPSGRLARAVAAALRQALLQDAAEDPSSRLPDPETAGTSTREHLTGLLTYCPPQALSQSFAQEPRWRSSPAVALATAHLERLMQHDPATAVRLGLDLTCGAAAVGCGGNAVASAARVLTMACRAGGWLSTAEELVAVVWRPFLPLPPELQLRWDLLVGAQCLTSGWIDCAAALAQTTAARALDRGELALLATSLLLQANCLSFAGKQREALPLYTLAVESTPVAEPVLHSAALRLQAAALGEVGRVEEARRQLSRAIELAEPTPLVQGHLEWTAAQIAHQSGELDLARCGFEQAAALLGEISLLDLALVTVDLVEVLGALGLGEEAVSRGRTMASVLMLQETNSLVEGAILELCRVAEAQQLNRASIRRARRQLELGRSRGLPWSGAVGGLEKARSSRFQRL